MGFLDDLERSLGRFNDTVRTIKAVGDDPAKRTSQDYEDWDRAARNRQVPKTRAQIVAAISARSPARYAKVRRDFKWLQKEAVRFGLSPEDARWLF